MPTVRIGAVALTTALAASLTACSSSTSGAVQHVHRANPARSAAERFEPLLQKPIPGLPGKSFTSAMVTFAPGAQALPHRHGEAFVFAYVLSGTVRSQVEGQPAAVYRQGDSWVENPGAHHLETQNVSKTEPANLLVTFVADTSADLKVDDPHH